MKRIFVLMVCLYASLLPAQMKDAQPEWYLPTGDGCSLFVQEFGHGPQTVVVLHGGWGAEHSYLFPALAGLEERYHLVFYDQRGSLRSPCPAEKITVQKHVDDLELLRKAMGLPSMNLAAHSMGTFLAMEYLKQHPDQVRGLVMFGTLPPTTPRNDSEKAVMAKEETEKQAFLTRPEIASKLHSLHVDKDEKLLSPQEASLAWHIRFAAVNAFHVDRWEQVHGGKAFYNQTSGQAAGKTMPQAWDFTPAIAARVCPTWVMNGDHDYADFAAQLWKSTTVQMPKVHIVVLKDAGHTAWVDDPEQFSKAIREALESSIACR